jgi:hypothetical protein
MIEGSRMAFVPRAQKNTTLNFRLLIKLAKRSAITKISLNSFICLITNCVTNWSVTEGEGKEGSPATNCRGAGRAPQRHANVLSLIRAGYCCDDCPLSPRMRMRSTHKRDQRQKLLDLLARFLFLAGSAQ